MYVLKHVYEEPLHGPGLPPFVEINFLTLGMRGCLGSVYFLNQSSKICYRLLGLNAT